MENKELVITLINEVEGRELLPKLISSAVINEQDTKMFEQLENDLKNGYINMFVLRQPEPEQKEQFEYGVIVYTITEHDSHTFAFTIDINSFVEILGDCWFRSKIVERYKLEPYYTDTFGSTEPEPEPEQDVQEPKKETKKKKNNDYPKLSDSEQLELKKQEIKNLFKKARDLDYRKEYPHKTKLECSYEEYSLKFDRHGENPQVIIDYTQDKGIDTPLREILRSGIAPAMRDPSTFHYCNNVNNNVPNLQKIREQKKQVQAMIKNYNEQLKDINSSISQYEQTATELKTQIAATVPVDKGEQNG